MGQLTELITLAEQRAKALGLPYKGCLTPREAYELLHLAPGATIVDVRTRAEWDWVGRIPGAIEIEWNEYPGGGRNPDFIAELKQRVDSAAPVLFLCRSGMRSDGAAQAASAAGYNNCYNILEGFEGDKNAANQRNALNGWRQAGLPWSQS